MQNKEDEILELMKKHKLPKEFIEEYETNGMLPYESQTILKVAKFLEKKLNKINLCNSVGYTKDVKDKIDNFYNDMRRSGLLNET